MTLLNKMLISGKTPQVSYNKHMTVTNAWYGLNVVYYHTACMDQDELFLLTKDTERFRFFVEGIAQELKKNSINQLVDPSLPEDYLKSIAVCKDKLIETSAAHNDETIASSLVKKVESAKTASEDLTATLAGLGSLPGERPLFAFQLLLTLSISKTKDTQMALAMYTHIPYYSEEN